jgi:hypothetical protein
MVPCEHIDVHAKPTDQPQRQKGPLFFGLVFLFPATAKPIASVKRRLPDFKISRKKRKKTKKCSPTPVSFFDFFRLSPTPTPRFNQSDAAKSGTGKDFIDIVHRFL